MDAACDCKLMSDSLDGSGADFARTRPVFHTLSYDARLARITTLGVLGASGKRSAWAGADPGLTDGLCTPGRGTHPFRVFNVHSVTIRETVRCCCRSFIEAFRKYPAIDCPRCEDLCRHAKVRTVERC